MLIFSKEIFLFPADAESCRRESSLRRKGQIFGEKLSAAHEADMKMLTRRKENTKDIGRMATSFCYWFVKQYLIQESYRNHTESYKI